jgi:hypothetical protein
LAKSVLDEVKFVLPQAVEIELPPREQEDSSDQYDLLTVTGANQLPCFQEGSLDLDEQRIAILVRSKRFLNSILSSDKASSFNIKLSQMPTEELLRAVQPDRLKCLINEFAASPSKSSRWGVGNTLSNQLHTVEVEIKSESKGGFLQDFDSFGQVIKAYIGGQASLCTSLNHVVYAVDPRLNSNDKTTLLDPAKVERMDEEDLAKIATKVQHDGNNVRKIYIRVVTSHSGISGFPTKLPLTGTDHSTESRNRMEQKNMSARQFSTPVPFGHEIAVIFKGSSKHDCDYIALDEIKNRLALMTIVLPESVFIGNQTFRVPGSVNLITFKVAYASPKDLELSRSSLMRIDPEGGSICAITHAYAPVSGAQSTNEEKSRFNTALKEISADFTQPFIEITGFPPVANPALFVPAWNDMTGDTEKGPNIRCVALIIRSLSLKTQSGVLSSPVARISQIVPGVWRLTAILENWEKLKEWTNEWVSQISPMWFPDSTIVSNSQYWDEKLNQKTALPKTTTPSDRRNNRRSPVVLPSQTGHKVTPHKVVDPKADEKLESSYHKVNFKFTPPSDRRQPDMKSPDDSGFAEHPVEPIQLMNSDLAHYDQSPMPPLKSEEDGGVNRISVVDNVQPEDVEGLKAHITVLNARNSSTKESLCNISQVAQSLEKELDEIAQKLDQCKQEVLSERNEAQISSRGVSCLMLEKQKLLQEIKTLKAALGKVADKEDNTTQTEISTGTGDSLSSMTNTSTAIGNIELLRRSQSEQLATLQAIQAAQEQANEVTQSVIIDMSGVLDRIRMAVCPTDGLNSPSPSCEITETSSLPEDQLRCMVHMMENELKLKSATDGDDTSKSDNILHGLGPSIAMACLCLNLTMDSIIIWVVVEDDFPRFVVAPLFQWMYSANVSQHEEAHIRQNNREGYTNVFYQASEGEHEVTTLIRRCYFVSGSLNIDYNLSRYTALLDQITQDPEFRLRSFGPVFEQFYNSQCNKEDTGSIIHASPCPEARPDPDRNINVPECIEQVITISALTKKNMVVQLNEHSLDSNCEAEARILLTESLPSFICFASMMELDLSAVVMNLDMRGAMPTVSIVPIQSYAVNQGYQEPLDSTSSVISISIFGITEDNVFSNVTGRITHAVESWSDLISNVTQNFPRFFRDLPLLDETDLIAVLSPKTSHWFTQYRGLPGLSLPSSHTAEFPVTEANTHVLHESQSIRPARSSPPVDSPEDQPASRMQFEPHESWGEVSFSSPPKKSLQSSKIRPMDPFNRVKKRQEQHVPQVLPPDNQDSDTSSGLPETLSTAHLKASSPLPSPPSNDGSSSGADDRECKACHSRDAQETIYLCSGPCQEYVHSICAASTDPILCRWCHARLNLPGMTDDDTESEPSPDRLSTPARSTGGALAPGFVLEENCTKSWDDSPSSSDDEANDPTHTPPKLTRASAFSIGNGGIQQKPERRIIKANRNTSKCPKTISTRSMTKNVFKNEKEKT